MRIQRTFFIENILNNQQFELFSPIASLLGTSFPIGFSSLKPGTSGAFHFRKESLKCFLEFVREKIPGMRPVFFFTDKEISQINVILDVYKVWKSLGLHYCKRPTERKHAVLLKNVSRDHMVEEKNLIKMLDRNCFSSVLLACLTYE